MTLPTGYMHTYICYYVRTVVFENFRVGSTASSCSSSLSSINIWKKSSSLSRLKSFHSNQFSCHQTTSIIHPSLVVPWSCSSNFYRGFSVKRKRNATKTTINSVNKKTKTKLKFHTYFVDLLRSGSWLFAWKHALPLKKLSSSAANSLWLVSCVISYRVPCKTYFPSTSILWFVLRGLGG